MNLHAMISGHIGAINPNQLIGLRVSVGNSVSADGTSQPAYATPGSLTASIGGTFTASIPDPVNNPTTLDVTVILTGSLQVSDIVTGSDGTNSLPAGTTIISQLTGTAGGVGTYQLSQGATLNTCTVTSQSAVLNVTAVAGGVPQAGQTLADATSSLLAGTIITGQISGSVGAAGLYSINQAQTVASEAMTTAVLLWAQVQPLSEGNLRHMDALNLQGSHRAVYINGRLAGAVRIGMKGGDLVTLSDGTSWQVVQSLEPFYASAGWTKAVVTLQAGT